MERIDSKTARVKLKPRKKPYWLKLDRGFALGYRKNKTVGGSWIVRRYVGNGYKETGIGLADDNQPADGRHILSFTEARRIAARTEGDHSELSVKKRATYTVEDAIDDYLKWFVQKRKSAQTTTYVCQRHIVKPLGKCAVQSLTVAQLRKWLDSIANSPRYNRGGVADESDPATWSADYRRRRRSTANRVLTVLKAALNQAWRNDIVADASAWQKVKPFENVDSARIRYLEEDEAKALVMSASDDFRPLVRAALLTGCRYGELIGLTCGDFDTRGKCIHLKNTKSGKPRSTPLSQTGLQFFTSQVEGKKNGDRIFTHPNGNVWAKSHQTRPMKEACSAAKIDPPIGFHVLRHTYATLLLRPRTDGSPGVPIEFVADALGNSVRVCEKHYAHVIQKDLEQLIEDNLPSF